MFISSSSDSLASRGLSVLRSVGGLVAINPEQTYVAVSIRGLGTCKSTYCHAERRELPATLSASRLSGRLAPLLAALVGAVGLLSACASYQPIVGQHDVTERGRYEQDLADCQNFSAPVSPGVSAGTGVVSAAIPGPTVGATVGNRDQAAAATRFGAMEGRLTGGIAGANSEAWTVHGCMG